MPSLSHSMRSFEGSISSFNDRAPDSENEFSEESPSYKEMEAEVSRAMVQLVRNEFRMSLHIIDRLIACFKEDDEWFANNYRNKLDKQRLCKSRLNVIRRKAKERLNLMRIYLAISLKSTPGTLGTELLKMQPYQYKTDPEENNLLNPEVQEILGGVKGLYPWIHHTYVETEMAPLNEDEVRQGLEILNNDLDWILSKYGGTEPDRSATCFLSDKAFPTGREIPSRYSGRLSPQRAIEFVGDGIGIGERNCYYKLYLAMIFGSDFVGISGYRKIEGFPLLTYMSSDTPDDQTIIGALERRREASLEAKSKFEAKYYEEVVISEEAVLRPKPDLNLSDIGETFIYDELTRELEIKGPEFQFLINKGKAIYANQLMIETTAVVLFVVGATLTCARLPLTALFKGLCKLPFGSGFNAYMLVRDEVRLRTAVSDMLMSPHGFKILSHVDSLSDYEFARNVSLLLLPVGTGWVRSQRVQSLHFYRF